MYTSRQRTGTFVTHTHTIEEVVKNFYCQIVLKGLVQEHQHQLLEENFLDCSFRLLLFFPFSSTQVNGAALGSVNASVNKFEKSNTLLCVIGQRPFPATVNYV